MFYIQVNIDQLGHRCYSIVNQFTGKVHSNWNILGAAESTLSRLNSIQRVG